MYRIRIYAKPISVLCALLMLHATIWPTAALAITGHESMPEFRSFEPVATTNMVNPFDGSFTYNLPLMSVPGGYPISLSYHHSEANNPEALASWVGLGWTLNPGAVNRMKRGFPDEFDGETVTYHTKKEPSVTVMADHHAAFEPWGSELPIAQLSGGHTLTYNNYTGLGSTVHAGLSLFGGTGNLNFSQSAGGNYGFTASVAPLALLATPQSKRKLRKTADNLVSKHESNNQEFAAVSAYRSLAHSALKYHKPMARQLGSNNMSTMLPSASSMTVPQYTGIGTRMKADFGVNWLPMPLELGEVGVTGGVTVQITDPKLEVSAYGYHNNEQAMADKRHAMDYFTEMEDPYSKRDNVLGYPLPNHDLLSVSGEGIGGSFRAYRNEFGHYRKNYTRSHDFAVDGAIDFAAPSGISIPPFQLNLEG